MMVQLHLDKVTAVAVGIPVGGGTVNTVTNYSLNGTTWTAYTGDGATITNCYNLC